MSASRSTFPPQALVIPHDDYHGKYVGRAADGDCFFLTTPFVPALANQRSREFVALYRFTLQGDLVEALIDDLGARPSLIGTAAAKRLPGNLAPQNDISKRIIDERLASLGKILYEDIVVKPFSLERFGVEFGLIPDSPEDDDEFDEEYAYVTLQPGDYMAFMAPWDGEYDT